MVEVETGSGDRLWHRAGFQLYWNWLSRHPKAVGRKPVSKEVRDLIFRMVWRIRPGAHRAFMENCSSLGSMFPNGRFRDGSSGATKSRADTTLEDLLAESSRSHSRHGLLGNAGQAERPSDLRWGLWLGFFHEYSALLPR